MAYPTINTAALAALELAINNALELDPALRQKLASLNGSVLLVRCTVPKFDVFILPGENRLSLSGYYEGKPDSTLSGPASEYVKLAQAQDKASALVNGGLTITGDSSTFLALQDAVQKMDLDFEQKVAELIGDIPAHQLGKLVRGSLKWGSNSTESMLRHIEEYIHEEARLAPPRLEIEDFFEDVQQLTVSVERLDARLKRIQRDRNKKQTAKTQKTGTNKASIIDSPTGELKQ